MPTPARVALVATELATNLIKHGSGGEILVGTYQDGDGSGIEIIALDKGRAWPTSRHALRDGYSSAGTRGNGLGAVIRQSHFVDIASWPGVGTAVLARVERGRRERAAQPITHRLGRGVDRHAGRDGLW